MEDPNWELKADYAELQDRIRRIRAILEEGENETFPSNDLNRREQAFNRIATAAENFREAENFAQSRKDLHSIIKYELMMVS